MQMLKIRLKIMICFCKKKWYFIIRWWWRWRWWFIIMMLILWETCSQFAREKKPRAKNPVMHPFPKWFSQHRYHFGTSQPVQPTKRFLLDDLSSETTATYPVRHMEKGNHLSNRFGTSFLVNLNFQNVLHQKLTYPRKINGWKMKFRFEMVPFLVDISIFARCSFILNHSKSIFCSMPCNLAGKSLSSSEECTPEGGSCSYMRDGSDLAEKPAVPGWPSRRFSISFFFFHSFLHSCVDLCSLCGKSQDGKLRQEWQAQFFFHFFWLSCFKNAEVLSFPLFLAFFSSPNFRRVVRVVVSLAWPILLSETKCGIIWIICVASGKHVKRNLLSQHPSMDRLRSGRRREP